MQRELSTSPVLLFFGVGLLVLGAVTSTQTPWLGALDAALGLVAVLMAGVQAALLRLKRPAYVASGAQAALGVVVLLLGAIGVAAGAVAPLPWFTFAFGAGLLATVPVASVGGDVPHHR